MEKKFTDIFNDSKMSYEDKIKNIAAMLDKKSCIYFICDCAERALSRVQNPHPDCVEVVRIAKLFADDKCTENDLAVAAWNASTHTNMLVVSGGNLDTKSYTELSASQLCYIVEDVKLAVWLTSEFAVMAARMDNAGVNIEYKHQLRYLYKYIENMSMSTNAKPSMPKTNKNNDICYFCGKPTEAMLGFGARYCPDCKK